MAPLRASSSSASGVTKGQNSSGPGQNKRVNYSLTPGPKTGESSRETYKNMFRDIREQQALDVTAPPSVAELAEQIKAIQEMIEALMVLDSEILDVVKHLDLAAVEEATSGTSWEEKVAAEEPSCQAVEDMLLGDSSEDAPSAASQ